MKRIISLLLVFVMLLGMIPGAMAASNPFQDVDSKAWYADAVLWAADKGITNGYGSADTFAPDVTCSRS